MTPTTPRAPMTTAELLALAERIEKASGPDREMDCEIWQSLFGHEQYKSIADWHGDFCVRYYPGPPGPEYHRLPRYTGSLDAALMLKPPGFTYALGDLSEDDTPWCRITSNETGEDFHCMHAATVPLALCSAALKAKARTGGSSHG